MAGITYGDMEMIKRFAKSRQISKSLNPNFTSTIKKLDLTTTPDRLGLMDYQQPRRTRRI